MGRLSIIAIALLTACAKIVGIEEGKPRDAGEIDAPPDAAEIDAPFGMFPAYLKASNTGAGDTFGAAIAISADGSTLVVGAPLEDSIATGVNGDQTSNTAADAGAAYVFVRSGSTWMQEAYLKASNTGAQDHFGTAVTISADGNTIAVGAPLEDSNSTGINGADNNSAGSAGAVYVFTRSGTTWTQQAFVKASNTDATDEFGGALALSGDGDTLAVGAANEDSPAAGINGNQGDGVAANGEVNYGAIYVFVRAAGVWVQQSYVKASNPDANDLFGSGLALTMDGNEMAVVAPAERSNAINVNGDQSNNGAPAAGAAYVFKRNAGIWAQQAYLKASNTAASDAFGTSIALSLDGNTLACGAIGEDSNSTGVGGANNNLAASAGAVYTFKQVADTWTADVFIKASNTTANDQFGTSVALGANGRSLAVGAVLEDSNADGINGDQADQTALDAGAVYVFGKGGVWTQGFYLKATNSDTTDRFGEVVSIAGAIIVTGAPQEDSDATGIGGNQASGLAVNAGAVYVAQ